MASERGFRLVLTLLACSALAACTEEPTGPLRSGLWGGIGISFEVLADSTVVEFDCASGVVRAPIQLERGRFREPGDYIVGHGGPIREGEPPDLRAASYNGVVAGRRLELTVEVEGFTQPLGPYQLDRGRAPVLRKCL